MSRKFLVPILVVGLLAAPIVASIVQTELFMSDLASQFAENLPPKTEELLRLYSIETDTRGCFGTVAKQLATELPPEEVIDFVERNEPPRERYSAMWFASRRVMMRQIGTETVNLLSDDDVARLPFSARFVLNVHAMLPDGTRRIVLFSREPISAKFEPRCW